eukprot:m.455492 g.455492  ORF g.455492 m.455492 type:complete len:72 (-) comp193295_c0_seq1:15-230(-)
MIYVWIVWAAVSSVPRFYLRASHRSYLGVASILDPTCVVSLRVCVRVVGGGGDTVTYCTCSITHTSARDSR